MQSWKKKNPIPTPFSSTHISSYYGLLSSYLLDYKLLKWLSWISLCKSKLNLSSAVFGKSLENDSYSGLSSNFLFFDLGLK